LRFLLIIIKIGTLFSPQKLFLPISAGFFLTGLAYYLYTYLTAGRFTNMSALLFISAVFTFLIGIVSEQISALHYKNIDTGDHEGEVAWLAECVPLVWQAAGLIAALMHD
jgi:predicted PurR-regulated permease PerM